MRFVGVTRIASAFAATVLFGACHASSPAAGTSSTGGDASVEVTMANLTVSPLTLTPAFSPGIHDYYVRCAAGSNALTVTMTAAEGGTVALTQPTTTAPASSGTADLVVAENDAIVVNASLGGATSEYWVRCLPHTFPKLAMSPHPEAGAVVPGYYLVGDIFPGSGVLGYAMALDGNGTPVWYGVTATGAGAKGTDFLAPNTISYVPTAGYTFGTYEGEFEIHTLDPVGTSFVKSIGLPVDTHELRLLPNGDYLVFASPVTTGVDLTGLGTYGPGEDILNGVIQEVSPGGQVVWQWTATDHLDPAKDSTWPQPSSATDLAGNVVPVVDPFHFNSLDVDANGNVLVSSRCMDSIFLISKATGQIMWKMGGSSYTRDSAPFIQMTGDPMGGFFRQHDARFQPDGTISLFDDETDLPGPARALVVSYDVEGGTASIVWQCAGKGAVGAMGSFTILPDGSRVIGWGTQDNGNPTFTEVSQSGADLMDFDFPDAECSYRALKIPLSAVDIETLRKAVGSWSDTVTMTDAGTSDDGQASGATDATASPDAADGGATPVVGCYSLSGTGDTEQCSYSSSAAPGFTCAAVPGSVAGSCPSADLYGCCVQTIAAGGAQTLSATCYYSAESGQLASTSCDLQAYQGQPYDWQTYAP